MKRRVLVALGILVLGVVTGQSAGAFPNPFHLFRKNEEAAPPRTAVRPRPESADGLHSFSDIARRMRPVVVNVATKKTVHGPHHPFSAPFEEDDPFSEFFHRFFEVPPQGLPQQSLGSGLIISPDGYIITNAHVVQDSDEIVITLDDERELRAQVVGIDDKTDLALLKADKASGLTVANLGNSDQLRVGDWVVAIGNPFGLSETVTAGIVSAKGRVIGAGPYDDFIQTDASINPGNSGGPLFDLHGEVVGINTAIFSQNGGNVGIGFAIPINLVREVVDQLRTHGKVARGWLGVVIQDVTPDLAQSFSLDKAQGALVSEVAADSPAGRAGLKSGDIILKYNGTTIDHAHALPALVARTRIGDTAKVEILRDGKRKTVSVKVGEMASKVASTGGKPASGDWGLTVEDITPEIARQLPHAPTHGVVVTDVNPSSPAAAADIEPGDVILEIDRTAIHGTSDYAAALAHAKKDNLLLLLQREGQNLFVALRRRG